MISCFFIGHRDAPSTLQSTLVAIVIDLIEKKNVTQFIVGDRGNFDRMATIAVQRAKKQHPEICAMRLLYYFPSDLSPICPESFDTTYYPEGLERVPKRFCIEKANILVLDNSDHLVAYVCHDGGNAAHIYRRAMRLESKGLLQTTNLFDFQPRG